MHRNQEEAMRKRVSLNGLSEVRSTVAILALLTIAAVGFSQARPCAAANADVIAESPDRSSAPVPTSNPNDAVRVRVSDSYGKLPLYFEANRGQTDPQAKFLSRGATHTLFLTPT